MNDMLFKSKKEMVLDEIEKIHRCHIDGDDFGPAGIVNWSLEETVSAYNDILQNLDKIPDLSEKDLSELITVLNERIAEAPIEDKKIQKEFEDSKNAKRQAFEDAKRRYEALSPFNKLRLRLLKQTPKDIMEAPQSQHLPLSTIEELYR